MDVKLCKMNKNNIFSEIQFSLKSFDSDIDPLKKFPKEKIFNAIDVLEVVINKSFQLGCTYEKPLMNFSNNQFADVDFFLIGQNLEFFLFSIINYYNISDVVYQNLGKEHKTLSDHLNMLSVFQKNRLLKYPAYNNLTRHFKSFRNAVAHVNKCPEDLTVRREYVKATIAGLVLITYYASEYKSLRNKGEGSNIKHTVSNKSKPVIPTESITDIQSIIDSF